MILLLGCTGGQVVTVLAASSLTQVFGDLEAGFETAHPDVDVQLSFAGSQTLSTQVRMGLRADAFASAELEHLQALHREGFAGPSQPIAGTGLALAWPEGEEGWTLERLVDAERLVVGAPEVPLGQYTGELLDHAALRYGAEWKTQVEASVVSREANARQVLTKVRLREADVAVVYATDLGMAGVEGLVLAEGPTVAYHQAPLEGVSHVGTQWLTYVQTSEAAFSERGFGRAE